MKSVSSWNNQLLHMNMSTAESEKPSARRTPATMPADVLLTARPLLLLNEEGKMRYLDGESIF